MTLTNKHTSRTDYSTNTTRTLIIPILTSQVLEASKINMDACISDDKAIFISLSQ